MLRRENICCSVDYQVTNFHPKLSYEFTNSNKIKKRKRTYEAGLEGGGWSTNLLLAINGGTLTVTVTSKGTTRAVSSRAVTCRAGSRLGLLQGGGDDVVWQVQVCAEELDTLVGEVPVVVSPVELLGDVATGLEGLHLLEDMQVGHVKLDVLGSKGGVLCHHNTLYMTM